MNRRQVFRILGFTGFLFALVIPSSLIAQTNVSIINFTDRPSVELTNVNYVSNRKPLQPLRCIKLPVTAIKPEGWLKKYLELQRDGLTGHLGEISAWLNKKDNAWLNSGGQNGWEEVPYWLKGYGNLAYILNDPKMIAETKVWLEAVFKSQQPNGYFGPTTIRMDESTLPNWHNVNVAQCFREPATYSMQTGDPEMVQASYNAHNLIRRIFGQVPGGMYGADENARMGYIDPRQGTETCGFVEQMASDEIMLRITGDPFWAEHAEDVAFNSYPAAVLPDFRALRYITCPNEVVSDSKNHSPGIENSGPFLAMNPFSSRCCQHNHSQGWPYYVEHLALATPDNGVAIALYGACTANLKVADNKLVMIKEVTNYPFEESVKLTLTTSGKVAFPFYLRIPSWCKKGVIKINGVAQAIKPVSGKYVMIQRTWNHGDEITLDLPMELFLRQWAVNKKSVSVNYGPLTFALKIAERYEVPRSFPC